MDQPLNLGPSGEQPAMLNLDYKHGTALADQYRRGLGPMQTNDIFYGADWQR